MKIIVAPILSPIKILSKVVRDFIVSGFYYSVTMILNIKILFELEDNADSLCHSNTDIRKRVIS